MAEKFTDAESRAAWNEGARAYRSFIDSGQDYYRIQVHGPALREACGEVGGLKVLDLGCGHGYFAREMARGGARVTGVDLSDELVAIARELEAREPLGIAYEAMSAAAVASRWVPGSFGLVTSCMAVQDMADVPAVLQGAARVLRPGGRMVFSVPHPCTDTPYREWERDAAGKKLALKLSGYFEGGAARCDWNMPRLAYRWETPCWRHTLSEWSAMISAAGFTIHRMSEPRPTPEQIRVNPNLEDCARMPYFLIFDLAVPSQG